MTTFKAKEPGWMSRLGSSAALYLALAIFVFGFTLYFFAFKAKRETESAVIERLERSIPGNRMPPTTQDVAAQTESLALAEAPDTAPAPQALAPTQTLAPQEGATPTTAAAFPHLRVLFIEGSQETFPGGSGTIAKEDIYERNGRDLSDSKFLLLMEKRWRDLHTRKEISDSYWTQDPRLEGDTQKIGVSVSVTPMETSSNRTRLEVYFTVQWPEQPAASAGASPAKAEFPVRTLKTPPFSVEISPVTIFFYGIPLPHRTLGQRDGEFRDLLSQNPILKMMTSPRFQAQPPQSEFFVLFESTEGN
ncbi:MAG: hypothetical protein K2X47_16505 [Bdellovibrionales bacterium]|nr:hypothetical protein [Bdellovibrionales bacterium]